MSDSVTPWTVTCQAPLSVGFSRQAYCSGLPLPSPGDLPNPGIDARSPLSQADSLPSKPPRKHHQFSHSVMSDSSQLHGLQHARLPCPSPTPRAYSSSSPSSWWSYPTISSCRPILLPPSIFPSIRVFFNNFVLCIRWPKYWSFSFSISRSNEHTGLISLRMDWLDLLALQGSLKSLLQHHSSKASILWLSIFLTVQLSNLYITTGKTIALTRWTLVGKVMSLLFNMLSRLVIAFLLRRKHLLISWLQSPTAVILEPQKIKSDSVSTVSPTICMKWQDQMP